MIPLSTSAGLAADTRSAEALRGTAAKDPKTAVRETAKQFEALFMQELMKSMRQATLSTGMFDNEGSKLGVDMLDKQFATQLGGMKGGLADMIARQLEKQIGALTVPTDAPADILKSAKVPTTAAGFVQQHQAAAGAVEAESGIPASFMLGQAAHESGWGRREILQADGSTSHNLFGIKAGGSWKGPVAEITTTEYVDGVPRKTTAKFRAYASYEESFRDYAKLIKESPRYQDAYQRAVGAGQNVAATAKSYAQELQAAGYATDPAYADKLSRVINTTLRVQRSLG